MCATHRIYILCLCTLRNCATRLIVGFNEYHVHMRGHNVIEVISGSQIRASSLSLLGVAHALAGINSALSASAARQACSSLRKTARVRKTRFPVNTSLRFSEAFSAYCVLVQLWTATAATGQEQCLHEMVPDSRKGAAWSGDT
jgi:hypothetical protein